MQFLKLLQSCELMKAVNKMVGSRRTLNNARVDKAFPASNGVSSKYGYRIKV
jgi:hypothetical protein